MQLIVRNDLPELAQRLNRLQSQLNGDLTPVFSAIGGVLESSTRERISQSKTAPSGSRWADLAGSTVQAKRDKGSILVERGTLMASITHLASQDRVLVGTAQHYGKYLQTGTRFMPAREFLGLSEGDKETVGDLLADWITGLV